MSLLKEHPHGPSPSLRLATKFLNVLTERENLIRRNLYLAHFNKMHSLLCITQTYSNVNHRYFSLAVPKLEIPRETPEVKNAIYFNVILNLFSIHVCIGLRS